MELKRFYLSNRLYFITNVTENRKDTFSSEVNIKMLLNIFDFYRKKYEFKIVAYCILPDHFHCLVIPSGKADVSKIMKGIKAYSAKEINRLNGWKGELWQHQFLDHIIRQDEDYRSHIDYIHKNPVKHGLVKSAEEYQWSSYRNYYLDDNTIFKVDKINM